MTQEHRSLTGRLLTWLNVLAANAAALLCVVVFVNPELLDFPTVPGQRVVLMPLETYAGWGVFIGCSGLLLLNLLWLVRRSGAEAPRNYVLSEAPGGAVRRVRQTKGFPESALEPSGSSVSR